MNKKRYEMPPESIKDKELWGFHWLEYATAVPSPLVLVTGFKNNGLANGTMQSWFCFSSEKDFYCIFGSVNKYTHMYEIAKNQKQLVVNFPDKEMIGKCMAKIENNRYDADELSASGLHYNTDGKVNAPIVEECFLSLECETAWERELFEGSDHVILCLKVVGAWFDKARYCAETSGRYGENGYLYNMHDPMDPETGKSQGTRIGFLTALETE